MEEKYSEKKMLFNKKNKAVVDYSSNIASFVSKSRYINSAGYYVIYDKEETPYFILIRESRSRFDAYEAYAYLIDLDSGKFSISKDIIANVKFSIKSEMHKNNHRDYCKLDIIEILDMENHNKGIGTQLYNSVENFMFKKGCTAIKGTAKDFRKLGIKRYLYNFYKKRGFKIRGIDFDIGGRHIEKTLNNDKMEKLEKEIYIIKNDNVNLKVCLPSEHSDFKEFHANLQKTNDFKKADEFRDEHIDLNTTIIDEFDW